jgi:hypothetical protein
MGIIHMSRLYLQYRPSQEAFVTNLATMVHIALTEVSVLTVYHFQLLKSILAL